MPAATRSTKHTVFIGPEVLDDTVRGLHGDAMATHLNRLIEIVDEAEPQLRAIAKSPELSAKGRSDRTAARAEQAAASIRKARVHMLKEALADAEARVAKTTIGGDGESTARQVLILQTVAAMPEGERFGWLLEAVEDGDKESVVAVLNAPMALRRGSRSLLQPAQFDQLREAALARFHPEILLDQHAAEIVLRHQQFNEKAALTAIEKLAGLTLKAEMPEPVGPVGLT